MSAAGNCPLCIAAGAPVIWRNEFLRVIAVDDASHPGYTRVIWNDHVKEMTDLPAAARSTLMETVWLVEQMQRDILRPDKVNLAQLGNMVPHVHWHIIPRWTCDSRFPEAIWAPAPLRCAAQQQQWHDRKLRLDPLLPLYHAALVDALSAY